MNHPADAEYFRRQDEAEIEELDLDARVEAIWDDLSLGRKITHEVVERIDYEHIDAHLREIALHIAEQLPKHDTQVEKILRGLLNDAVLAQAKHQQRMAAAEGDDFDDRYRYAEGA